MTFEEFKEQTKDKSESDFPSFYRVEVYAFKYYDCFDPEDPEDRECIPYIGEDHAEFDKVYAIYESEWAAVLADVKHIVEHERMLYRIRVYHLPFGVMHDNNQYLDLVIFNSQGEEVYRSGSESEKSPFEPGMIVEYHLPEEHSVYLAIVVKEASDTEESDPRNDEYRLLNLENKWCRARISDVSEPSFPVSESFRERLEGIYKKKLMELDEGTISFTDLLELL
ncbi:MAG: hypothetical protein K2H96_11220, partial [Muribaculaceae bacterium]|nr:hypothetical protein [Muribaculaceae bacterium]